jgi:uncharacterized protein with FMN-binding domain
MKRALSAAAATLAGFGAVLGLHSAGTKSRVATSTPTAPAPSGQTTTTPRAAGPAAPTTTLPPGRARTATGPAENYGYGILATKVTVRGGRITDVALAGIRVAESYSQMLAQQVVPILRQEVLSAQSAQVNTVSGATYTSEAYLTSAQTAIDKAKA